MAWYNILKNLGDINNFISLRGEFYNELKIFFEDHQGILLWFFNTRIGKRYGGIPHKEKITKISPNAYHIRIGKNKYKMIARTYPVYAKRLYQVLRYIPAISLSWALKPLLPFAFALTTTDFYSTGGDGVTYREYVETWATARAATTCNYVYTAPAGQIQFIQSWTSGSYHPIRRAFFPFDTSSLTSAANISAATLNIYGYGVANDNSVSGYVVETTQASTSSLTNDDYDNVGSTSGGTIAYSSWNTSGYNAITLNATGRGWISKTGITKIGMRDGLDFNNTGPATSNNSLSGYMSGETGTSKDPYLEVTYTNDYTSSVSSNLILSDNIDGVSDYSRSLSGAITLTDNVDIASQVSRELASALTIADANVTADLLVTVYLADSLSVTDVIDITKQISRSLESTIATADNIDITATYGREASSAVTLTDSIDNYILITASLTSSVVISDNIDRVLTIIGKSIAQIDEVKTVKPTINKIDKDKPILYSIRKG